MPSAYVLINTETSSEDYVLKQLKNVSGVRQAYISYGVYDLIVKVQTDNMDELKEIVSYKIRTLDKVRSTLTLMLVDE